MSARSYLSIGDVLTLLRQEFPDITISKIRFLESQGLVNPERTPSGYRKFYEHDVERLRWVLRQQREHFLPLKVIKDRLDDDANGAVEASEPLPASEAHTDGAPRIPEVARTEPVLIGQHAAAVVRTTATGAADDGATLPGIESTRAATTVPPATSALGGAPPAASGGTAASGPRPSHQSHPADRSAARDGPPATRRKSPVPSASADEGAVRAGGPSRPPAAPAGPSAAHRASAASPVAPPPSNPTGSEVSGVSLTVDELAGASDLDVAVVRELQEFGLLSSSLIAGVECFDEDALTVASLASRLAAFGIEPRHLRLYKNAADREAGFIEQIVIPLVRQRNPEARARAQETADELTRLGQQLRASLLRHALGSLLNG